MKALVATALLGCALGACARDAAAQAPVLGDRAAITLRSGTARAFVGQTVVLHVEVRLEERFWREHLIQLFRQHTDLAVRVVTPWASADAAYEVLGPADAPAGGTSAIVDGAVAALQRRADETRDGVTFACFEVARKLVCRRAGPLRFRPAELHFAWAPRFGEDLLGERVPEGREDRSLRSEPATLEVVELPEAGRPAEFTGLVGELAVQARLDAPPTLRVGDALVLRVAVEGEGDLRPFRAPTLDGLVGLVVRGVREETGPGRRVALYELVAARAGRHALPRLAVAFFSPTRASYASATSPPLEVAIAPTSDGATALPGVEGSEAASRASSHGASAGGATRKEPAAVPGVDVPFGPLAVARREPGSPRRTLADATPPGTLVGVLWLAAPWLVLGGVLFARHRTRTAPERAERRARRAALATLRHALATPGTEPRRAWIAFLATGLRCPPAAVVGPRLLPRLGAVGVAPELATRAETLLDALEAARFGGVPTPPDAGTVLALAEEVERAWRAFERRPRVVAGAAAPAIAVLGIVASLACAPALAQQPHASAEDLPTTARRLLDAGDAAGAFDAYRKAFVADTHDPAALCFDLAICVQRLGRPAEAVLWYERALGFEPLHAEARANLHFVQRELGLADAAPKTRLALTLEGLEAWLGASAPHAPFALGAVLTFAGLCWLILSRRPRRALGTCVLLAGLAVSASGFARGLASTGETAVVLVAGTRLLSDPHERASAVGTLKPGDTVRVLERSPRWARVRRPDGIGWVEAPALAFVALR